DRGATQWRFLPMTRGSPVGASICVEPPSGGPPAVSLTNEKGPEGLHHTLRAQSVWSLQMSSLPTGAIRPELDLNTRKTAKLCPWGNGLLKNHDRIDVAGWRKRLSPLLACERVRQGGKQFSLAGC